MQLVILNKLADLPDLVGLCLAVFERLQIYDLFDAVATNRWPR